MTYNTFTTTRKILLGGGALCAIVLTYFAFGCFTSVPAGKRGVVIHFGKVQDHILGEGFHFKSPIGTQVEMITVQVQRNDLEVPAGTKDLQTIETKVVLNWHLDEQQVNTIYRTIGGEKEVFERIIDPAVNEILKAATPRKTLEEVLKQRAELKVELDRDIKARLDKYGIKVDEISIVNVGFSDAFAASIEAKQVAEQDAKKAEYVNQKAKKEVEAEVYRAKGQADAEISRAKGQAEAQRLQRETLTPIMLQKQAIEKWDGKFPTMMTGSGVLPMVNMSPEMMSKP